MSDEERARALMANLGPELPDVQMGQAAIPFNVPAGPLQAMTPAQIRILMKQVGIREVKTKKEKAPGRFAGNPEGLKQFRIQQAAAARLKRKESIAAGGGKISAATKFGRIKSGKRVGSNPNTVSSLKAMAHASGMRISKPAITQLYQINLNGKVLKIAMELARNKRRMTVKPEDVVLAVYTFEGQHRG